jgi:hypothetical protein
MVSETGHTHFEVDEVLEIKGWLFKIVLVDPFTNKICMKRISDKEAAELRAKAGEKK